MRSKHVFKNTEYFMYYVNITFKVDTCGQQVRFLSKFHRESIQSMWSLCGVHIDFMNSTWSVCGLYVDCMWSVCGMYVEYMWSVCGMYVEFMWSI